RARPGGTTRSSRSPGTPGRPIPTQIPTHSANTRPPIIQMPMVSPLVLPCRARRPTAHAPGRRQVANDLQQLVMYTVARRNDPVHVRIRAVESELAAVEVRHVATRL